MTPILRPSFGTRICHSAYVSASAKLASARAPCSRRSARAVVRLLIVLLCMISSSMAALVKLQFRAATKAYLPLNFREREKQGQRSCFGPPPGDPTHPFAGHTGLTSHVRWERSPALVRSRYSVPRGHGRGPRPLWGNVGLRSTTT